MKKINFNAGPSALPNVVFKNSSEAVKELDEMDIRPSQYNPGNEIPEKNIAYRLAKKFWFNDYGAYSKHFQADQWIDTRTENPQKPE